MDKPFDTTLRQVAARGDSARNRVVLCLYAMVLALFMGLSCTTMLTRGMYADGLVYTAIASNYAEGDVAFWQPRFTSTINGNPPPLRGLEPSQQPDYTQTGGAVFYAHPPLMMYMLSIWMRLAGSGMVAAKGYSILVAMLTAVLIVRLWRRLGLGRETGWLPLLLWALIPPVTHYAFYNMLEPTMLLFVLASGLCMLRTGRREWAWHLLAGVFLFGAFMTKEFPGLFPLALPALLWLTKVREGSFGRMVGLTLCAVAGLVVPFAVLLAVSPAAMEFFRHYFDIQIMGQARGGDAPNRLAIVGRFLLHGGIAWGLVLAVMLVRRLMRRPDWLAPKANLRIASAMVLLSLCGVVPLAVSAKQSDYFLLTAFPFFALSMAALLEPWAAGLVGRFKAGWAVGIAAAMLAASVVLNVHQAGRLGRDIAMQEDLGLMVPWLERGEVVSVPDEVFDEHFELKLAGYCYLDNRVSLDSLGLHRHILTTRMAGLGRFASATDTGYRRVELPTAVFTLYEKIDN